MTRPDTDWMIYAACHGTPIDVFYPEIGVGAGQAHIERAYATAKAYCTVCPVQAECLRFCLPFEKETGRRDGMWGGLTPQDRNRLNTHR